jgi:hypothetical protein
VGETWVNITTLQQDKDTLFSDDTVIIKVKMVS